MKINVKAAITDYEGKPVMIPGAEEGKETELTYFDVFIQALNSQVGQEVLTAELKNKIYQISKKIYGSNEPNFTPDQLVIIKERVGKAYNAMVYGKVCDLIDGTDDEPKKEVKEPDATPSETSN